VKNFYKAWWYLFEHEYFEYENLSWFLRNLHIMVVMVDPKTKRVEDDEKRNTEVNIWLEAGARKRDLDNNVDVSCHDIRLDCGGKTFEEAIIAMAKIVKKLEKNNKLYHDLEP